MLSVNTSISLMIGHRSLMSAESIIHKAAERIMTGKRINRASDDPAGLQAVSDMDVHIASLKGEIKNLGDREALLGAQEGALSVMGDLLLEMQGLVVTAANQGGLSDEERQGIQTQADSILEALDKTWVGAKFKGERLFDGLFTTTSGVVEYDNGDEGDGPDESATDQRDQPGGLRAALAALGSGKALNLVDGDIEAAQKSVDAALKFVNGRREGIGNEIKNTIEPKRNTLLVELENITKAKSDIEDADIAQEMSNLIRGQILEQSSIYSLLIAKQTPNAALQLLQGSVQLAQKQ